MGERDDDRIWRAAFREGYRRGPRAGELSNYKYWHWVSRNRGFDVAGPWECWPSKPIPEGAALPEPEPVANEPEPPEPMFWHCENMHEPLKTAQAQCAYANAEVVTVSSAETVNPPSGFGCPGRRRYGGRFY